MTAGLGPRAPLLTSTQGVVLEDRKMERQGRLSRWGWRPGKRWEKPLVSVLKVLKTPKGQDPKRWKAPQRGRCGRGPNSVVSTGCGMEGAHQGGGGAMFGL